MSLNSAESSVPERATFSSIEQHLGGTSVPRLGRYHHLLPGSCIWHHFDFSFGDHRVVILRSIEASSSVFFGPCMTSVVVIEHF